MGLLSSCAKKDNTTSPAATFTSTMSATFNGTAWTAASVTGGASSGTMAITGTNSNSTQILIEMPTTVTAGTYSPDLTGSYHVLYTASASDPYYISSGSIVVTSNANNIIKGTFSGTMTDVMGSSTMTCTNGAFSAKYQ